MNVLVTGGSGDLAGYLVPEFSDHDLLLVDVVSPPADRAHLPFLQCDLTNIEDCRKAMAECEPEVIVALGALRGPTDDNNPEHRARRAARAKERGGSPPSFDATMKVNVLGLYYLMMAAVEAGVKAVIQAGSIVGRVTGGLEYQYLPVDDAHPTFPVNSYNYSKIAGELMLQWFTKTHGIQTIITRPAANIPPERLQEHARTVGPAQEWSSILWHYADSRDVAWAHRLAFDALDRLPPHDGFLIHAADHMAMEDSRELVERFRPDLLDSIPVYLRGRQAFVSCEKAYNAFGYRARYSWTDYL